MIAATINSAPLSRKRGVGSPMVYADWWGIYHQQMCVPRKRLLTVFLVLVGVVLASTAGAGVLVNGQQQMDETAQQAQPETDSTVTQIQLHENGSATWEITYRTRLDSEEEITAYTDFQEAFRDNRSTRVSEFESQINRVVSDAEATTGRNMSTAGFTASTRIESTAQNWGVVTYQFQWSGFTEASEGSVQMGDVFAGGYFISSSGSLSVTAPENYTLSSVSPSADSNDNTSVTWQGQRDFSGGNPSVIATEMQQSDTSLESGSGDSDRNWLLLGVVGLLVIAGGVKGFGRVQDWRETDQNESRDSSSSDGDPDPSSSASTQQREAQAATGDDDGVLLSDEERVLKVLRGNEGRMKQAEVADVLEWSSSKTSRVLQQMEKDGEISRLRIGRENVIDLSDDLSRQ